MLLTKMAVELLTMAKSGCSWSDEKGKISKTLTTTMFWRYFLSFARIIPQELEGLDSRTSIDHQWLLVDDWIWISFRAFSGGSDFWVRASQTPPWWSPRLRQCQLLSCPNLTMCSIWSALRLHEQRNSEGKSNRISVTHAITRSSFCSMSAIRNRSITMSLGNDS